MEGRMACEPVRQVAASSDSGELFALGRDQPRRKRRLGRAERGLTSGAYRVDERDSTPG